MRDLAEAVASVHAVVDTEPADGLGGTRVVVLHRLWLRTKGSALRGRAAGGGMLQCSKQCALRPDLEQTDDKAAQNHHEVAVAQ